MAHKGVKGTRREFHTSKGSFIAEADDILGSGTYGVVYRVRDKKNPSIQKAIKTFTPETMDENEGIPSTTLREINALRTIDHPNVITAEDVVIPAENALTDMFVVMELCRGTLKDKVIDLAQKHLNKSTAWVTCPPNLQLPPKYVEEAKLLAWQLLNAVAAVHSHGVMHRDLKPANVMWGYDDLLKLGDFGLARFVRGSQNVENNVVPQTGEVQTMWYRAPEVLLGDERYGLLVDDWSIGCVVAEFFRFRMSASHNRLEPSPLFQGRTDVDTLMLVFETLGTPMPEKFEHHQYLATLPFWTDEFPRWRSGFLRSKIPLIDDAGLEVLTELLQICPSNRTACRFLLEHRWFDDVRHIAKKLYVPWYRGLEEDYVRMAAVSRLPPARPLSEVAAEAAAEKAKQQAAADSAATEAAAQARAAHNARPNGLSAVSCGVSRPPTSQNSSQAQSEEGAGGAAATRRRGGPSKMTARECTTNRDGSNGGSRAAPGTVMAGVVQKQVCHVQSTNFKGSDTSCNSSVDVDMQSARSLSFSSSLSSGVDSLTSDLTSASLMHDLNNSSNLHPPPRQPSTNFVVIPPSSSRPQSGPADHQGIHHTLNDRLHQQKYHWQTMNGPASIAQHNTRSVATSSTLGLGHGSQEAARQPHKKGPTAADAGANNAGAVAGGRNTVSQGETKRGTSRGAGARSDPAERQCRQNAHPHQQQQVQHPSLLCGHQHDERCSPSQVEGCAVRPQCADLHLTRHTYQQQQFSFTHSCGSTDNTRELRGHRLREKESDGSADADEQSSHNKNNTEPLLTSRPASRQTDAEAGRESAPDTSDAASFLGEADHSNNGTSSNFSLSVPVKEHHVAPPITVGVTTRQKSFQAAAPWPLHNNGSSMSTLSNVNLVAGSASDFKIQQAPQGPVAATKGKARPRSKQSAGGAVAARSKRAPAASRGSREASATSTLPSSYAVARSRSPDRCGMSSGTHSLLQAVKGPITRRRRDGTLGLGPGLQTRLELRGGGEGLQVIPSSNFSVTGATNGTLSSSSMSLDVGAGGPLKAFVTRAAGAGRM